MIFDLTQLGFGQINEMFETGQHLKGLGKGALAILKAVQAKLANTTDQALKAELLAMLGELVEKLLEAQIAQADILHRLHELEQTLITAHRAAEEAQRYELATFSTGASALALKHSDPKGEPFHYLCQPCFDDGKKRVLQPFGRSQTTLECPTCKTIVRMDGDTDSGIMLGRVRRGDLDDL